MRDASQTEVSSRIRLNTIGYLPGSPKRASVAGRFSRFTVVRVRDGKKVYEGKAGETLTNADTEERITIADFSVLQTPGEYRLQIADIGSSPPFRISADVYNFPFYTVTRAMYLWRCGTAVSGKHQGNTFSHGACHTEDAYLDYVGGGHVRRDATGGWHDAGDYNKYVVNAGVTVGVMLRAWEDFGTRLRRIRLDIPESGGKLPDYLAEIRWEIDWLLKMQADDGSVYHKISTRQFGPFILPEQEKEPRFYAGWSTAATADFVAMTAAFARAVRPYDRAYAERCLQAARKSWAFLQRHPEDHKSDTRGLITGGYQTDDPDDRLWAVAELWETTGDPALLKDLEGRIRAQEARIDHDFDWPNVRNLGMITYLLSRRGGRDSALVNQVKTNLIATADRIVQTARSHGYARPLGNAYYWGCNGSVARQAVVLHAAYRVTKNTQYLNTILDALNHLFGRNFYGRSFVTGLGYRPPMRPHDRRSGGDKVDAPWPGYLVGGSHPGAKNWQDVQEDYRTNEIAINWNAALIYALAAFVQAK
ncbi:MAG: endoglucanase [Armatimonadota bacterium]|nr:MAG: endoglucanase [Armatimonadota bacterium]